ncbi:BsuPI-related putative proteinase inhibitor [Bacillus sp. AK031]
MKKIIITVLFSLLLAAAFPQVQSLSATPAISWKVKVEPAEEYADIQLMATNTSAETVTMEFPSSKFYDYEIKNAEGKTIYKYSDNKSFLQAIQLITLKSGETKTWRDKWNFLSNGKRIPSGVYSIKASIFVKSINGKPADIERVKQEEFSVGDENPSFKDVGLSKSGQTYKFKGKAKVSAGCFYYMVEDGHNIVIEETLVKVNKKRPNWADFSFSFELDPESISDNNRPLILNLYERDLKDGTVYHSYAKRIN